MTPGLATTPACSPPRPITRRDLAHPPDRRAPRSLFLVKGAFSTGAHGGMGNMNSFLEDVKHSCPESLSPGPQLLKAQVRGERQRRRQA
jgi:hypothetical protein